jgi:hypothetical protein
MLALSKEKIVGMTPCGHPLHLRKELSERMSPQIVSSFATAFRRFIAEICISLFLWNRASKSHRLLITTTSSKIAKSNQIQREFLFNNCIQSQNISSASKYSRQKTNFPKPNSLSLRSGRCCHFAPPTPPVNPQIKTTFLPTLANHPPNPIV